MYAGGRQVMGVRCGYMLVVMDGVWRRGVKERNHGEGVQKWVLRWV